MVTRKRKVGTEYRKFVNVSKVESTILIVYEVTILLLGILKIATYTKISKIANIHRFFYIKRA